MDDEMVQALKAAVRQTLLVAGIGLLFPRVGDSGLVARRGGSVDPVQPSRAATDVGVLDAGL